MIMKLKKRNPKQIAQAGITLGFGMALLPLIPLNKKSRFTSGSITSKVKKEKRAKI
jgi:hypothetical protein